MLLVCKPAYKVAEVAGPRNYWPNQGPSNGVVIFYDAAFFGNLQDKYSSVF